MIRKVSMVLGLAGALMLFSASAPPDVSSTGGCCQPCDGSPCHAYAYCAHDTCSPTVQDTTCSGTFTEITDP